MDALDLTNCDREPIHIPGQIQAHGALLAFDLQSLTVL
jgi:light-regulated signal transduction histidine kinase (bacteriophytochrome)